MASDDAALARLFFYDNPEYKRHPNYTKTDQLPISEVITGLPRPYHHKGPFFPPYFPLFFSQEKQEKQSTFPNFGNLTEGKIFERHRIPNIWGEKNGKYVEIQKFARTKKMWKFRRKSLR